MDKLALFKEIEVDLNTFEPRLDIYGEQIVLSGKDALVMWIAKALSKHSARFEYTAYSASYGNELNKLIGISPELSKSLAPRLISDCLMVNPYITGVRDFELWHEDGTLYASFCVDTVYGSADFKGKEISLV